MSINYDFGDLEAFLAVKETGSFHGAGDLLNLSQSAVTRRIAKLEQALDTVLFERTTRAVKPTLAAKRLQTRAEAILEEARETAQAMRDDSVAFAYQRRAIVTLAVVPTLMSRVLIPAVSVMRQRGINTRLRLLDQSTNGVVESVSNGEADFGLCSLPSLETNTHFEPLFEDRIVLFLPREHPLSERSSLAISDLAETPLILPARGTGNRILIDEALARTQLPIAPNSMQPVSATIAWAMEVERSTTALDLVSAGLGVALLPEVLMHNALKKKIIVRQLNGIDIARPVGILTRDGQSESDASAAVKRIIRDTMTISPEPLG